MSRTLLLADGSVTIQRVVELTFAHEDIRVVTAADGRRAIQLLESERPDVVMADVDLPEVDGYALAAHMRRIPRLKDVPLLLLAGAFEPVDQDRAREVGSDGVVMKPFEPQVVVSRVRELIEQRIRQSAPAKAASDEPARPAPSEPTPPVQGPFGRQEPSFPRIAPRESEESPMESVKAVPEPLELPTRPMWDPGGSVTPGTQPGSMPFPTPPPAAGPAATAPPAAALPPIGALPSLAPAGAPGMPRVTLASAFTALLAAEQTTQPNAPAISEATIEDAVRRVLVRMTDDLVRRIVLETAERLIREEIEKIKATPD
jgi:CheY-like chemotaxis protein